MSNKYGDPEQVTRDAKTLHEIISRQGVGLLLDAVAEFCGESANKFTMTNSDRKQLIDGTVDGFREALEERL